jgi:hypothetical protein
MRDRIFVSYSHKDVAYLKKLESMLTGIYRQKLEVWSDENIKPGDDWENKIISAIASSRVALLLVSRNFLRSDFIVQKELPAILRRDEPSEGGAVEALSVLWVPLERLSESERINAKLHGIQAVLDPSTPLSPPDDPTGEEGWLSLVRELTERGGLPVGTTQSARQDLKAQLQTALASVNTHLGDDFGSGDYSFIYRATRFGEVVAIKALVPDFRREWLAQDFIDRAHTVKALKSAATIPIRDVVSKDVKCVVMDFEGAPTLKTHLKQQESCLDWKQTADILAQLAGVAVQLHRLEGQPLLGTLRPSHLHYDPSTNEVRISLVHINNETMKSCHQKPTVLLDPDALTYLSPERYAGGTMDARTDQYNVRAAWAGTVAGKTCCGRIDIR